MNVHTDLGLFVYALIKIVDLLCVQRTTKINRIAREKRTAEKENNKDDKVQLIDIQMHKKCNEIYA